MASRARELLHAPEDAVAARRPGLAAGADRPPAGRVVRPVPDGAAADPGQDRLAIALFDAHLCVAEYVLYGPVPYDEVIELAEELRTRAEQVGALRGVAFATALIGEAALLMGDLDRAERELRRRSSCTATSTPPAGEAHSLQRLAEVRLARATARRPSGCSSGRCPLARWSVIGMHLLQRIYGTMIAAAPDPGRPGGGRPGRGHAR